MIAVCRCCSWSAKRRATATETPTGRITTAISAASTGTPINGRFIVDNLWVAVPAHFSKLSGNAKGNLMAIAARGKNLSHASARFFWVECIKIQTCWFTAKRGWKRNDLLIRRVDRSVRLGRRPGTTAGCEGPWFVRSRRPNVPAEGRPNDRSWPANRDFAVQVASCPIGGPS
jgi:hypothetical protein